MDVGRHFWNPKSPCDECVQRAPWKGTSKAAQRVLKYPSFMWWMWVYDYPERLPKDAHKLQRYSSSVWWMWVCNYLEGLPNNAYKLHRYFPSCDECELAITWKRYLKKYKGTLDIHTIQLSQQRRIFRFALDGSAENMSWKEALKIRAKDLMWVFLKLDSSNKYLNQPLQIAGLSYVLFTLMIMYCLCLTLFINSYL